MDINAMAGWETLLGTLGKTVLAYVTMVFLLRVSGKRTLSTMNTFDFVVTVSLGSALATVCLSPSVPLAGGAVAFVGLIFMQYLFAWISVRVPVFKRIITSEPTLLVYQGKVLHDAMKRQRIMTEDLDLAVRRRGEGSLREIEVVILETTGDFTVIRKIDTGDANTLRAVDGHFG